VESAVVHLKFGHENPSEDEPSRMGNVKCTKTFNTDLHNNHTHICWPLRFI